MSHSKNGIYEGQTTGAAEIFYTFTPVLNTLFALISWLFFFPKKYNTSKFFNIKY